MDLSRFAEAYPRNIDTSIGHPEYGEVLTRAGELSAVFGDILHDAMEGRFEQALEAYDLVRTLKKDYAKFVTEELRGVESEILRSGNPELQRHLGLANYHWLNFSMLPMWALVLQGKNVSEKDRRSHIHAAKDLLAYDGCEQYVWRDRLADSKHNYRYFDADLNDVRMTLEGRLHERDAAIVLLDIAERHKLLVVPAPRQFEDNDVRVNADFIVCDPNKQTAVGVQVKSKVTNFHRETYNPDFIVLIDGQVDLENAKMARTSNKRTEPRIVSWAGIISAHAMTNVKTFGEHRSFLLRTHTEQEVRRAQFDSKIRLGGMRCNPREIAKRLEPRILSKLTAEPTENE